MLTHQEIKRKAEDLIRNYGLTTPFSVSSLAAMMGIDIEEVNDNRMREIVKNHEEDASTSKGEIIGYFNNENKKIYVSGTNQPLVRQRFTIAHELAHYVLHSNAKNENDFRRSVTREDLISFIPNTPGASEIKFISNLPTKEKEANEFAAYLLIPDTELEKRLPLIEISIGGEAFIRELANLFGVSLETMRIRLKTFKEENSDVWQRYNLNHILF